ncbi:3'-5' exonuclease [Aeromonas dhakensis]|uniref:3'-5' exonuclease n=1 Tax=Aeromonas dhakensis TaxID=196024 RepID=UPI003988568F
MAISLSQNQSVILKSDSPIVYVDALAGTGKTTLLKSIAHYYIGERILYLVYNKDRAEEARMNFGPNVMVATFSAYVWGRYRDTYHNVLDDISFGALNQLLPDEPYGRQDARRAPYIKAIISTLNYFFASTDTSLLYKHIVNTHELKEQSIDKKEVLSKAKRAWDLMRDPTKKLLPMTHASLCKLFLIEKMQMAHDIILCDEVQDFTPSMVHSVLLQRHAKRILVGDQHQKLYGFRHAVNPFSLLKEYEEKHQVEIGFYTMQQSYRAGNRIIDCARRYLEKFKAYPSNYIGRHDLDARIGKVDKRNSAILFRYNSNVLNEYLSLVNDTQSINIIGGLKQYDALKLAELYMKREFNSTFMSCNYYRDLSFDQIRANVDYMNDGKTPSLIKLFDKHDIKTINMLIGQLETDGRANGMADISISTVHKFKGLESENVILGWDVKSPFSLRQCEQEEEINIGYVGITRAKCNLELPRSWFEHV